LGACADNDEGLCPDDINCKWQVLEFISVESVLYAKNNDYNPTIEFLGDGTTSIRLDINSCFGSYETGEDSGITISNSGCTEACCDSDFSLKFMEMLPQVSSYELENERLKLNVPAWGWIELKAISD
jgi:heat shock protein HslJ